MASHRGKKVGVWLSVLVVLVPLALQGAGVAWAWHTFGGHPLFWILAALLLAAALFLIGAARSRIREINGGEEDDLVNTDYISGKELETLGLVQGSTIQSKNIGRDISQGFKTLVGGELKAYTDMMNEARALATKRMVGEAEALGADGVVNIRYASSTVMQGAAEVIAYGTAVKFK